MDDTAASIESLSESNRLYIAACASLHGKRYYSEHSLHQDSNGVPDPHSVQRTGGYKQ